jgi:RimJ/RimL family protein N-acetyltransferase
VKRREVPALLGPILEGERIRLEPSRADWLPDYISWFADMRVTRYLLLRTPMSLKQEEEWFEATSKDRNTVHWAITLDGQPIGVTGIHNIDWISRGAMTGTLIGLPSEWGKGYATEAVRLRTAFAFRELNLERLETFSFAPNAGMHKALERAGYRRIGTRTRSMFREGSWHDTILFELLRSDWETANTAPA